MPTMEKLGLVHELRLLTSRIGLWDFLCDEVNIYKAITFEFLGTVSFDRTTNTLSFRLEGRDYQCIVDQLLYLLRLPTNDIANMNYRISYKGHIPDHEFQAALTGGSQLKEERGEENSAPHPLIHSANSCVHSSRARNSEEPHLQPHLGYYLAKHLIHVATEHKPNGNIYVGGVITKITPALNIDITVGDPVVVPRPTTLNLQGLVATGLIKKSSSSDTYYNLGTGDTKHTLPLTVELDPLIPSTWSLVREPVPAADTPARTPASTSTTPPHPKPQPDGPSNQMLYDWMGEIQTQLGQMQTMMGAMQIQLNEVDDRSFETWWKVGTNYDWHVHPDQAHYEPEDPPTPPRLRRKRQWYQDQHPPGQ